MYLAVLKDEEKELFLNMVYRIAVSDDDFSEGEQNMIAGYCQEMQTSFDAGCMTKSIEEIISQINQISNVQTKRIIVFEAVGLAMADGNYDDNERQIIAGMEQKFGLDAGFADGCEAVLQEYIVFQNKINKLVLG